MEYSAGTTNQIETALAEGGSAGRAVETPGGEKSLLQKLFDRLLLITRLRKERRALASLSPEQLADIGVSRANADRESARKIMDVPDERIG